MSEDFGLIKGGVVTAVALFPAGADSFGPEPDGEVRAFPAGTVVAGRLWDGEVLSDPEPDPAPEPGVPDAIDLWRVRVILGEDDKAEAIDAWVAGLPDTPQNRGIKQRWLGPVAPPKFVRDSALVQLMVAALPPELGVDQDYIDDVLVRARALPE